MKFVLTICLLLISTPSIASGQQRGKQAFLSRAQTREAERLLSDRGYWTGVVDGLFDPATRSALIAFQKWRGALLRASLHLMSWRRLAPAPPLKPGNLGTATLKWI